MTEDYHLSVLRYVRKALKTYLTDEDYLFRSLMIDGEGELAEVCEALEEMAVRSGVLFAGGRMGPSSITQDEEDSRWRTLDHMLQLAGKLSDAPKPTHPSKSDLIDIGILSLILEKLETGTDRLAGLDLLSLRLPKALKHLHPVFWEAHFNYILGNRHAVAAMCGALIESAAKHFAPGEYTSRGKEKTVRDRIKEMREKRLLDAERAECAQDIWERRGYAAHADPKFGLYNDGMIEKTLLDTRKILEELYKEQ